MPYLSLPYCGIFLAVLSLLPLEVQSQVVLNEICADNGGSVQSPGLTSPDYVELYNTGTSAVSLNGWSLTDDLLVPTKYTFPTGTSIAGRGYIVLWLDNRTNYAGLVTTNFSLKSSGETVGLFQGSTRRDSVKFGPQVKDLPLCRLPNGTGGWIIGQPSPLAANKALVSGGFGTNLAIRINEWLATNSAGANSDWLELYNPDTNGAVALGGLVLSDIVFATGTAVTTAAIIPNSFIAGGGFLRLWCDGSTNSGNHIDLKLSHTLGETLSLYQPNRTSVIDRVTFGPQSQDVSMGRLPDGGTNFFLFAGTNNISPGAANAWGSLTNVVINEVLSHTDPPLEDAIELFNPTDTPLDIGQWYLSNSEEFPLKFKLPANTILPPHGYRVFFEQKQASAVSATAGFNRSGTGNSPDFTFNSAHGDTAVVTEALPGGGLTGRRLSKSFGPSANGVSFGRYVKSDGGSDFVAMSTRSFGTDQPGSITEFRTGSGLPNPYPLVGPLVITEIHYHPPDRISGGLTNDNTLDEFIELTSVTNGVLPLYDPAYPTNTWRMIGGITFVFPTNQTVAAQGRIVLVNFDPKTNAVQLAAFRSLYSVAASVPLFGPYAGALGNRVDTLQLERPDPVQLSPHPDAGFVPYVLVEKVKFESTNGWPTGADGTGRSLHRISLSGYANDQTNWMAAVPGPGLPENFGTAPVVLSSPESITVIQGGSCTFSVAATGTEPLAYHWRFAGTNILNGTSSVLPLSQLQPSDAGSYAVVVSNAFGAVTSAVAVLTVGILPSLAEPPAAQFVAVGTDVTFHTSAGGTEPLAYEWRFNTLSLPGQTSGTLLLPNAQTNQSGLYAVVVTNLFGSITSAAVRLSVAGPPQMTLLQTSPGNNLQLQLVGVPGHRYDVEAATNLSQPQWVLIGRITNSLSTEIFVDPMTTNFGSRFYRTKLSP